MAKARLGQVIGRLGHGWAPSRLHVGTGYYQTAARFETQAPEAGRLGLHGAC